MKPSEFEISTSVKSYDEKTPKNNRRKAQFPNYRRYQSQILIAQIKDFNEDHVKISRASFYTF